MKERNKRRREREGREEEGNKKGGRERERQACPRTVPLPRDPSAQVGCSLWWDYVELESLTSPWSTPMSLNVVGSLRIKPGVWAMGYVLLCVERALAKTTRHISLEKKILTLVGIKNVTYFNSLASQMALTPFLSFWSRRPLKQNNDCKYSRT